MNEVCCAAFYCLHRSYFQTSQRGGASCVTQCVLSLIYHLVGSFWVSFWLNLEKHILKACLWGKCCVSLQMNSPGGFSLIVTSHREKEG